MKKRRPEFQGVSGGLARVLVGDSVLCFRDGGVFDRALTTAGAPVAASGAEIAAARKALPDEPGGSSNVMLGPNTAWYLSPAHASRWREAPEAYFMPRKVDLKIRQRAEFIGHRRMMSGQAVAFLDRETNVIYLQDAKDLVERKARRQNRRVGEALPPSAARWLNGSAPRPASRGRSPRR